jgi:DNA-directed RNA polymerase subunit M/transcription elongation factor TFIIS
MIVVERPCDKCGEPTRSNEPHVCKPKAAKKRVVTKKAVVTPKPKETVTTKSDSDRVKRWREANREHYNTYMRKRRAADKAKKQEPK